MQKLPKSILGGKKHRLYYQTNLNYVALMSDTRPASNSACIDPCSWDGISLLALHGVVKKG